MFYVFQKRIRNVSGQQDDMPLLPAELLHRDYVGCRDFMQIIHKVKVRMLAGNREVLHNLFRRYVATPLHTEMQNLISSLFRSGLIHLLGVWSSSCRNVDWFCNGLRSLLQFCQGLLLRRGWHHFLTPCGASSVLSCVLFIFSGFGSKFTMNLQSG